MKRSPIQKIRLLPGYECYIKRDDLLDPVLGGNKARKLHFLLTNPPAIDEIVSFGSLHSNAMAALSVVARRFGWRFVYYAKLDPRVLAAPAGNLKLAIENGMELRSIERFPLKEYNHLAHAFVEDRRLIVPEGVRCKEAQEGVRLLAEEIMEWARGRRYNVFLPSGTGTTALFLQKYLGMPVYTVACVGDAGYLKEQFALLEPDTTYHPTILQPPRKYRFGRLYRELFELWQKVRHSSGVEFDLLYDPVGIATLLEHGMVGENLLYIHQGGLLGNETMIARYKRKFDTIDQIL